MSLHRVIPGLFSLLCLLVVCGVTAAHGTERPATQSLVQAMTGGSVRGGLDQLYRAMEERARSDAGTSLTTIELVERFDFTAESETDGRIVGSATYYVHLRGSIVGRNRYLVIVRVRGEVTRSGESYATNVLGSTTLSKTKK